ncbi:MAG: rRNA maturation RNase YbeY [Synergistaceae bacterium]|nr:rRNA maturation RNase YbeY [Synergistaceae bacterium]
MKLSLRINFADDNDNQEESCSNNNDSGNDFRRYNFDSLAEVLEGELLKIYPDSKNYEFAEISITFTDSEGIKELNNNYRNINEATDVLSFPLLDDEPVGIPELPVLALGDIVICPEEVKRLHGELSESEGLCLMIAHSFLHLLGFDHDTDEKENIMFKRQDEIKAKLLEVI